MANKPLTLSVKKLYSAFLRALWCVENIRGNFRERFLRSFPKPTTSESYGLNQGIDWISKGFSDPRCGRGL